MLLNIFTIELNSAIEALSNFGPYELGYTRAYLSLHVLLYVIGWLVG